MAQQIAKTDLDGLTARQKAAFHKWPEDPKDGIHTHFEYDSKPSTWYSPIISAITCTTADENKRIFTADKNMHVLHGAEFVQPLPALEVKKQFAGAREGEELVQIAWSHNIAAAIVENATFFSDTTEVTHLDRVSTDQAYMWLRRVFHERNISASSGNVPMLEEWTTRLPSFPVSYLQPWAFSRYWSDGYPLFRTTDVATTLVMTIKRYIVNVLRIRTRDAVDSPWVEIGKDSDTEFIRERVAGVSSSGELPNPELLGAYSVLSKEELENKLCDEEVKMWYEDWVPIDDANPVKYGTKVILPLKCKYPAIACTYCVENVTSSNRHNYSNYTTNATDVYSSWENIAHVVFKHGTVVKYDMSHELLKRMFSRRHLPASPTSPGYGIIPFCHDLMTQNARTTIVFEGKLEGTLSLHIGHCNPHFKPVAGDHRNPDKTFLATDDEFLAHVRLLVLRELTFTFNDKTNSYKLHVD